MPPSELTWLGQASFLLEAEGVRVLIDPWTSPHEGRLIPPPPDELLERIDWVLVTHEHLDHLDLDCLRRLEGARLVLPAPIADQAEDVRPLTGVQPGETVEAGPLSVEVVRAVHGVQAGDAYTDGGGRFVGYVIRGAGPVLYHSGDTIATDEVVRDVEHKGIEVALLPINGRDYFRERQGIIGNLDYREAVRVARLAGARILVPMHWDGFAGNTERPGAAVDEAAVEGGLHVLVLARGVPYRLA